MKQIYCCVALALAACGSSDPVPTSEAAGPAENAAAGNAAAPASTASPAAAPSILLEGQGLRLASSGPLPFGTDRAATVTALTAAFGKPPSRQGANAECGAGPMRFAEWDKALNIWFLDGRLAGWDTHGALKTADGIGLGSSRPQVAELPGFSVEETSLGTEFSASGLGGLFASKAANAKVDALWAGNSCVFR
jgi:hypothetical protein